MASVYNQMVGANVRRLLAASRRSQTELCAALGWEDPYLSRRMTNRVSFSLDDIEQIATVLDVPRSLILDAPIPRTPRKAANE